MRLFAVLILIGCSDDKPAGAAADSADTDDAVPDGGNTDGVDSDDTDLADSDPPPPSRCEELAKRGWIVSPELEVASIVHQVQLTGVPDAEADWYAPPNPHIFAMERPVGGTALAWAARGGGVHVTLLEPSGLIAGTDLVVPGAGVHGFVALDSGYALLVSRAPDALHLVGVDHAGDVQFDTQVLAGADWWQTTFWMGDGRLLWTGTQLVAYVHVSSGGHEGDTLRYFTPGGDPMPGGWGWGCSHSMDQRLGWDGLNLAPVCLSDCYPGQGVFWANDEAISLEPGGNCAGEIDADLGGLAPAADGWWLSIASSAGRDGRDIRLFLLDVAGRTRHETWLTDTPGVVENSAGLVRFGTGLLAGWRGGGENLLARVDTEGQFTHGPHPIGPRFSEHGDMFAYFDDTVGWAHATAGSDQITLVNVADCL